jgi:hypothetical protein
MLLLLPFLIIALPLTFFIVSASLSAPRYNGPVSDHFNGKTFTNPGNIKAKGLSDVLKWMLNRKRGAWKANKKEEYGPRPLEREKENIRITFINHSTFLIRTQTDASAWN